MYKYDLADMMLICVDKKKNLDTCTYSIWYTVYGIYTHMVYILYSIQYAVYSMCIVWYMVCHV